MTGCLDSKWQWRHPSLGAEINLSLIASTVLNLASHAPIALPGTTQWRNVPWHPWSRHLNAPAPDMVFVIAITGAFVISQTTASFAMSAHYAIKLDMAH